MTVVPIEKLEKAPTDQYGQARILGTPVTVHSIVLQHRVDKMTPEEIATVFDVDLADVYTALAYYYDHQAIIDRELALNLASYEAERAQHTSPLDQKIQRLGLALRDVAHYLAQDDHEALSKIRRGEHPELD